MPPPPLSMHLSVGLVGVSIGRILSDQYPSAMVQTKKMTRNDFEIMRSKAKGQLHIKLLQT